MEMEKKEKERKRDGGEEKAGTERRFWLMRSSEESRAEDVAVWLSQHA